MKIRLKDNRSHKTISVNLEVLPQKEDLVENAGKVYRVLSVKHSEQGIKLLVNELYDNPLFHY
ncbi:hypothetical protein D1013_09515 [Euzebyella marina]|uniref:Uncharacterized protein n=1 Tax=Euzebyella marina TaxID=1761453 RepID=A0A3G2L5P5_9FLAO|nr:hypothetical protein D1013_09515 [Euzebyella marina]